MGCYPRPMPFDQYVYPSHEAPLLDAWGGRFESVFVLLHPFIGMPDHFSWRITRQYPDDEQILAHGEKCPWSKVAAQTALGAFARISQGLLTSIGSLDDSLSDDSARDKLLGFLQSSAVWMPAEGRFEPLLHSDILHAFDAAGFEDVVYVPEIPEEDPICSLSLAGLNDRTVGFPQFSGSLVASDESFLFTVDWDSFFTLFYGPRAFVQKVVHDRNLEGFFAGPTTEHAWFNYSMGCATVTVSPEHWPA